MFRRIAKAGGSVHQPQRCWRSREPQRAASLHRGRRPGASSAGRHGLSCPRVSGQTGNANWLTPIEVSQLFDLSRIPRERAKNDRAHQVHLTALAVEVIEDLPRLGAEPRFVLTTTGSTPVSGYSKAKAALDRNMPGVEPWTFHDLRRTAATGMARLNIAPHVVDRVLNHVSGTIR